MNFNPITKWFPKSPLRRSDPLSNEGTKIHSISKRTSIWIYMSLWLLVVYGVLIISLGWYWSREPALLSLLNPPAEAKLILIDPDVIGSVTTGSLIMVADTLLSKQGGYLANDILPPGLLLDNIPNWEYGVLIQVRDLSKALREAFSRSQSQSTEDRDLTIAEPRFNFGNESWILPSSESVYRQGIDGLERYHSRLLDPSEPRGQFYARADNLAFWLGSVEKRLGSLSQRLSASVGQRRLNTDLAGETKAKQSTFSSKQLEVKTPWGKIDDVFFEARGTTWALIHFLRAVDMDFSEILQNKNATISLRQIIRELEATQRTIYSPVILNGGGFGLFANHSLVMASYISRAHTAIIDLRELLTQG
ncbi:MAG: hypothetical protein ACI82Z_001345 [Cellvibrionaceae bacterium]|jgi:hypothetical protein